MSSPSVALLVVSHDGARWLPTVIEGIRAQTVAPDRVVAVDTGSKDESAQLLRDAFGRVHVVRATTSFPEAVELGLEQLRDDAPEWIWILHDDATPDPRALEWLLIAAEADPGIDILGPKLREWPSLRRLLELGVTISGTGRRETGLERGEYDQGQHDEVRTVLAVNTAGMLVRRDALERLGGLDPQLPIFGNDIDLGWRAARAGMRTMIVPDAVVFHAEAAHRGLRRTPLTGRHTHFQERRAALYTLLVNARARTLPLQLVRLFLGTLLRMVGFLLVRSPGEALDELAALVNVYASPRQVHAARRARRRLDVADPREVRRLLAPPWLPYRHGLDFLGDVVGAVGNQAADVAERRRVAAAERDPASFAARRQAEADDLETYDGEAMLRDSGVVVRFLTNPVAVGLGLVVLALLVGTRAALGTVVGGGLSPAPDGVGAWWGLIAHSWHPLGQGSEVPAPAYLLPLTLLATLVGSPAAAVSIVLVVSPLLGLWGGWRLLRVVGRLLSIKGAPRWLVLWGATTFALVPLVSGAWSDGRLGPVVAGAALPWAVHAALGFADPEADRRWRAAWRTGLLLTLITAFTPVAWVVCLLLATVLVAAVVLLTRGSGLERSAWAPPLVALAVPVVLLAVWWLPALLTGAGRGLLMDAGAPPLPAVTGWDLALGRLPHLGAPWWLGLVLPLLAVAALVPARTRVPVLACWVVGVVAAVVALALSAVTLRLGDVTTPPGTTFLLVLAQGAAVVATVIGTQGALTGGLERRPMLRGVGAVVAAVALVVPVGGLVWTAAGGHGVLTDSTAQVVPAYMLQEASTGPEHGILVLRGGVASGVRYHVVRGDGTTLGEDEVQALTPEDDAFTALVRDFVSRPSEDTVRRLAAAGVQYVVQPAPADPAVSAAIDATGGLSQASAQTRRTRAWQLDTPPSASNLHGSTSWLHVVLLVVELVGLVAVVVLSAPTVERRRKR